MPKLKYVVYKLTFPNGKIYVGKDIGGHGHSMRYFGSWDNKMVEQDFTRDQLMDFTLRKEVLFEADDKDLVSRKEIEFIRLHDANNPIVGYNRNPKYRASSTHLGPLPAPASPERRR